MSDDMKCVAGCVPFYGGEKRHHKDCPHYPESLTKANADRIEELEANLAKAVKSLEYYGGWSDGRGGICGFDGGSRARTTLAELKGQDDE